MPELFDSVIFDALRKNYFDDLWGRAITGLGCLIIDHISGYPSFFQKHDLTVSSP